MKEPYYPKDKASYGSIYFYIKSKTFNLNPFDQKALQDAMGHILAEASEVCPSYKLFISAATKATNLSERTINKYVKLGRKNK